MFKCKISSKILNNKQIQEVKKLKRIAKHEYQEKMKTKNGNLIQTALTHYVETQKNLRTIINNYITRATEKKLQYIQRNGYISKYDWNIVRQLSQNNVEDLYTLKNDGGLRLFCEDEIKNYTNYTTSDYTQNTHYKNTKKNVPTTQKIKSIYTSKTDYMKVMNAINQYISMK